MAGMYNRYIPNGNTYTRVTADDSTSQKNSGHRPQQETRNSSRGQSGHGIGRDLFRNFAGPLHFFGGEEKNAGIAGILKGFDLEDIDSGDILLLLIILLLFLEGDNTELVITLGLMLLLGLGDTKKEDQTE